MTDMGATRCPRRAGTLPLPLVPCVVPLVPCVELWGTTQGTRGTTQGASVHRAPHAKRLDLSQGRVWARGNKRERQQAVQGFC